MTTTYTTTDYRPGQRIRYGCQLHNTGTFVRYMDEIPASVLAGRIVCIVSDHWIGREASDWEKYTAPAELGDIGGHYENGRYVGPNYGWSAR